MSKYDALWTYIQGLNEEKLVLRFADIAQIAGTPLDHSFLKYKKELAQYGYAAADKTGSSAGSQQNSDPQNGE